MKKIIFRLSLASLVILLIFIGCDTTSLKPHGYMECPIQSIVRDENNNIYIPIDTSRTLTDVPLFQINSNSLVKSNYLLKDIALVTNPKDYVSSYRINIDNTFHFLEQESGISKIIMNETKEKTEISEFVITHYDGKINFDDILSDIQTLSNQDNHTLVSAISIYPDGLYIAYSSKTEVNFKDMKQSRGANPGPKGLLASYYRFYPASSPEHFTEVKIPFGDGCSMWYHSDI